MSVLLSDLVAFLVTATLVLEGTRASTVICISLKGELDQKSEKPAEPDRTCSSLVAMKHVLRYKCIVLYIFIAKVGCCLLKNSPAEILSQS